MNPPGTEILGPISKFKKRNKISSLLVYVLHKTRNWAPSRRSRAKTGKEMYKKSVMHVESCCFAYRKLLFFFTVSLPSASVDLKVPNDEGSRAAPTNWGVLATTTATAARPSTQQ